MTCQHSSYSFILIDRTRHCSCFCCGHQFSVILGSGLRYSENETDAIHNDMTGAAFEAMRSGALKGKPKWN